MTKMTKPQKATMERLWDEQKAAGQAVYDVALPRMDIRFFDCLKMASPDLVARYHAAVSAIACFEQDMVSASRGYRDSRGMFVANT